MSWDFAELPTGWHWLPLAEIAGKPQYGWTTKARVGAPIKLVRTTDITSGSVDWESVPGCDEPPPSIEKYELRPGDIVVSRAGSVGYSYLLDDSCPPGAVFASYLMRVRPDPDVALPAYVQHFMRSPQYWSQINDASIGIGLANVNGSKLGAINVPVAPSATQRQMTTVLESADGLNLSVASRIASAKRAVNRLRRAVLAAAYSRRIVHDADQDWPLVQIGDVLSSLDQGWSPQCLNRPAADDEWGVIKTTAVQQLSFQPHENKALPDKLEPRSTLEIAEGDLLVTRAGPRSRVGISCLVKATRSRLMICDKVYRMRIDTEAAFPDYVAVMLNTPQVLRQIDDLKTGTSDSGMNLTQKGFARLEIPVPPVHEQERVVRGVDELFAVADRLDERLESAVRRVDRSSQAVLAKAFRGDLISDKSGA